MRIADFRIGNPHFISMKSELPEAGWKEKFLLFIGKRKGFRVEGDSMFPVLKNGDLVLIDPCAGLSVGDIVLARHPFKQSVKIIKRIAEITADEKCFLIGDNAPESTDSRAFGKVSRKNILGKIICRLK